MFKNYLIAFIIIVLMYSCSNPAKNNNNPQQTQSNDLLVIVVPSVDNDYYADYFNQIVAFDIQFAKAILGKDKVVVVVDSRTLRYVQNELPDSIILVGTIDDIWIRDFGPVVPQTSIKFDYRPQYLSRSDADCIDNSFETWFNNSSLQYGARSTIILDGGNFVYNGSDKAIITMRIVEDNRTLTRTQIENEVKTKTGISQLAIIPYETGDTTGHADGMVMWIDQNTLCLSQYDEPFRTELITTLNTSFSGINIVEIPYNWDGNVYDGFGSACGIYANGIVTEKYIYIPTYNIATDSTAISIIRSHTSKQVVGIDALPICFMGGSIRCLSWHVKGENMNKILALARN